MANLAEPGSSASVIAEAAELYLLLFLCGTKTLSDGAAGKCVTDGFREDVLAADAPRPL